MMAPPAAPAGGRRQEGYEIPKTNSGSFNALLVFRDLVTLLLARGASSRRGVSSRFLTCLLRGLSALCADVVTSNRTHPSELAI